MGKWEKTLSLFNDERHRSQATSTVINYFTRKYGRDKDGYEPYGQAEIENLAEVLESFAQFRTGVNGEKLSKEAKADLKEKMEEFVEACNHLL